MSKYVLGLDFGTKSVRSLLVDIDTGEEIYSSVYEYKNGVIDRYLPESNIKLPIDTALQDPKDYEDGLEHTIKQILNNTKVNKKDIIGLGIDSTSCTMLPIKVDSTPLCYIDKYRNDPNSWVKLWKHHSAQKYATKINNLATKRGEKFLSKYGGKISSEWLFPKIMQIAYESPDIYKDTDIMIESGDWIVYKLTGNLTRNTSSLGYKSMWDNSFPNISFFKELDPKLEDIYSKLSGNIKKLGNLAGYLNDNYQKKLNLPKIPIAAANIDAHVAVPACTVTEPKKMVIIIGTSACHMVLSKKFREVKGVGGIVKDGIIAGYFGYEAGQASVGDIFEWFIQNSIPYTYFIKAKKENISIYDYLTKLARKLKPGQSGLIALDWFNGNRSILMDSDLSGLILGLDLSTKPEEIYRALLEATAFGTRRIIESFEETGIKIDELYICGGLVEKNKILSQIYSDITRREIKTANSTYTSALGSAMHAAVASGYYSSIKEAAKNMAHLKEDKYNPLEENTSIYNKLYDHYIKLYNYFGLSKNSTMRVLKKLKRN
ncbi:MAG: ribulokinase [Actinobacteria bacterium RBG_19FT_COMBO_36_27]|nr:MAG: ribulokinase [Actinobacteria bacterium RBG_19FT_COMBO_36_27]